MPSLETISICPRIRTDATSLLSVGIADAFRNIQQNSEENFETSYSHEISVRGNILVAFRTKLLKLMTYEAFVNSLSEIISIS